MRTDKGGRNELFLLRLVGLGFPVILGVKFYASMQIEMPEIFLLSFPIGIASIIADSIRETENISQDSSYNIVKRTYVNEKYSIIRALMFHIKSFLLLVFDQFTC